MIVKLLLIPYYIGSFLLGVIFVLVGLLSLVTIFWLASFGLGFVAFMMLVYNYLLTLSTSSLNIARMIKTYDEYPLIIAAIITIAHFIMVFDVASAIYLYLYHKNKKNVINIRQEFKEELPN